MDILLAFCIFRVTGSEMFGIASQFVLKTTTGAMHSYPCAAKNAIDIKTPCPLH